MGVEVASKRKRVSHEALFFLASLLVAVMLVATVVGKTYWGAKAGPAKPPRYLPVGVTAAQVVGQGRSVLGEASAASVIVEFGDYQCPPCRRAHQRLSEKVKASGGKYRLVFRHFPLEMHKSAFASAVAAEMAGESGKFEQMHDLLYSRQAMLSDEYVSYLLKSVGVATQDVQRRRKAEQRVKNDTAFAEKIGITGTPTLILCVAGEKPRVVSASEIH